MGLSLLSPNERGMDWSMKNEEEGVREMDCERGREGNVCGRGGRDRRREVKG